MASAPDADDGQPQVFLPDFCAASTILVVVLVAELVAIVLTLAAHTAPGTFLIELSKTSMLVLWIGLLSAAVLCKIRPWLEKLGKTQAFVYSFVILQALSLILAEIAFQLMRINAAGSIVEDSHGIFLLRTFAISSIIIALAMRYLYVASEWRRNIVLEAQARVSALQALIRPHFLFNSMNTIASLTRTDPQRAEEAVEDLADLLRANLGGPKNLTTLKEELEVAAIYQRVEKLRLGDRLNVRWKIDELPMRAMIPSLTIQPLLENAIYHGIELLPEGGEVMVMGTRDDDRLEIDISNPVAPSEDKKSDGNKMALSNIQQRFELAYASRASVTLHETASEFRVHLSFPCEENTA